MFVQASFSVSSRGPGSVGAACRFRPAARLKSSGIDPDRWTSVNADGVTCFLPVAQTCRSQNSVFSVDQNGSICALKLSWLSAPVHAAAATVSGLLAAVA